MKADLINRKNSNARGRRDDGATTRAQLLEAAGEIFAEKGLDRATGKEIADRAGTNSAAVNYYFGGLRDSTRRCWSKRITALSATMLSRPSRPKMSPQKSNFATSSRWW